MKRIDWSRLGGWIVCFAFLSMFWALVFYWMLWEIW